MDVFRFHRFGICLILLIAKPIWAETPDYGQVIRPILSDKCFRCHGPDEESRAADLRLDQSEAADYVLSRDKPAESELIARILSDDPDERMPPPDSKFQLTKREIELLKQWVDAGSKYEEHWAFQTIRRPKLPTINDTSWVRSPIDLFILKHLERAKLNGGPQTDKASLIRRVTLDLTGIPPTLREVDDFLSDKRPDAYEQLVERLLQRPQFGERLASNWLDVARYSDSYGYQVDRDRFVWPWRDWVIRNINGNLPFDRFVTLQLAGDLVPNPTDDDLLATTFGRLHPQKVEGGSVPEEFRVEYVADRNHTVATTFLGLTLECARCHDHKYDPISQQEYYQLFAFFNNIDEAGLYSYFTNSIPTPTLIMSSEDQKKRIVQLDVAVAAAEKKLEEIAKSRQANFETWLVNRPQKPVMPDLAKAESFEKVGGANKSVPGKKGNAVKLTGDDGFGIGVGNYRRYQPFSVSLWMKTPDVKERAVVFHRSRAWTDAASRGYELLLEDGRLSAALIHFYPGNAIRVRARKPLPINEWTHVVISYDGSSQAAGLSIYVNGEFAETEVVRDNLYKQIAGGGGDNITIGQRFRDRGFTGGEVDEFHVYGRRLSDLEVAQLFDGAQLQELLAKPIDQLTDEHRESLREYYLSTVDKEFKQGLQSLANARKARNDFSEGIREIMVMRELKPRRKTYVLKRGAYDAPAKAVAPQVPAALPPLPKGSQADRLGLAQWLTSPENPLTARVAVNRYWQLLMGEGIVRTPEDFGSQGQPPTHPQLLDWLAAEFIKSGWDVKQLIRTIVTSSTYRQTSTVDKARYNADPENLLFSRSLRYRLPAEMVRDHALAVSELLLNDVGGAPARPYELSESFKPLAPDKGRGLFRRSVYTYWKRTGPAPVMMALDAAKRDVCMVKRERTSSPLQALVLLNDPQFVEAARVMAERQWQACDGDIDKMIRKSFRTLTSRLPSAEEHKILKRLYDEQVEYYRGQPKDARLLASIGKAARLGTAGDVETAAATVLINTIMNFDECVIKR